jgi:hypothetical protein
MDYVNCTITGTTTTPTVSAVSPENGAKDVPLSGKLVITFNKSMTTTSGVGIVSLGGGTVSNGSRTWSSNNTVCTISYSGLTYNTKYTYNISGFQDASGNAMTAITSGYSFTTVFKPWNFKAPQINIGASAINAYFVGDLLKIESSQSESIAIYSTTGIQLYSTEKNTGLIEIPFPSQKGSIYIVKGSESGTVKVVKTN